MWNEDDLSQLSSAIDQALDEAMATKPKDYERLIKLSEAQTLIQRRQPGDDLDALIAKVMELVGNELVGSALGQTARVAPEEKARPAPPPAIPEQPPEPTKVASAPADGTSVKQAPPTPDHVEVRPAPRSEQLDDTQAAALLVELRTLLADEPSELDQLPAYLGRLQAHLERIKNLGWEHLQEVRSAEERLEVLKSIRAVAAEVERLTGRLDVAAQTLDLGEADRVRDKARSLPGVERDPVTRVLMHQRSREYERLCPALARQLFGRIIVLIDLIDVRRQELSAKLNIYITKKAAGTKEAVEESLSDLRDLETKGVATVPSASGVPTSRAAAYNSTLEELLVLCQSEAQRLNKEAECFWKDYQEALENHECEKQESHLDSAEERCKTSASFLVSTYFGPVEKKKLEQEIRDQEALWRKVTKEINTRWTNAQSAHTWYDQARDEQDPIQALKYVQEAEKLFPCLTGLSSRKSSLVEEIIRRLKAASETLGAEMTSLNQQRQYGESLKKAASFAERLALIPADVGAQIEPFDLSFGSPDPMTTTIDSVGTLRAWRADCDKRTRDEQNSYRVFDQRAQRIKQRSPQLDPTTQELDPAWLAELKQQFSVQDLQTFADEWEQIVDELTTKAGPRANYHRAQARFDQNHQDPQIVGLLKKVPPEAADYKNAQDLLRRHMLAIAMTEVRWLLAYPEPASAAEGSESTWPEKLSLAGLTTDREDWLRMVRSKVREAQGKLADDAEDRTLREELQSALTAAETLYAMQANMQAFVHRAQFEKARAELIKQDGRGDAATAAGLRWLRQDLRRQWRGYTMDTIRRLIKLGAEHGCQPVGSPTLSELERASDLINELETAGFTEDGDGQLKDCVRRVWRLAAIRADLGIDLTEATDVTVQTLLDGKAPATVWRSLHRHLHELRRTPAMSPQEQKAADALYAPVLGYAALEMRLDEALAFLEEERQRSSDLRQHPALCSMLVLRLMEQPDGEERANELVSELRVSGRSARRLADALSLVIDAFRYYEEGNMPLAIDTLDAGTGRLKEIAPDFAPVMDVALEDTKTEWRGLLGEALLREASERESRGVSGIDTFVVLSGAKRAAELLPAGDRRASGVVERLRDQAREELETLRSEIEDWLASPPERFAAAVAKGLELKSYLQDALGPDYKSETPPRARWQSTAARAPADIASRLNDRMDRLQRAQREVQTLEAQVRQLFKTTPKANWRWHEKEEQTPYRELRREAERLVSIDTLFGGEPMPAEQEQLRKLIDTLDETVTKISSVFERFRAGFEGDTYANAGDFDRASELLDSIKIHVEDYDRQVRDCLSELQWEGLSVSLDQFFLVYDHLARPQRVDGQWTQPPAQELRSRIVAVTQLNGRKQSWQTWQSRTDTTRGLLEELNDGFENARKALLRQGHLSRAVALVEDQDPATTTHGAGASSDTIPGLLRDLGKQRQAAQDPPACQLAHKSAQKLADFDPDPDASYEIQQCWNTVRQASRLEIAPAWQAYLGAIIAQAEQDLQVLRELCRAQRDALDALLKVMDQHVKYVPDNNATVKTQRNYDELIRQAEAIDRDDDLVKGHRNRYGRRQSKPSKR